MRKRFLTAVIGCAMIAAGVIGASAQTKMPQMRFRERTLANGLRVLSVVDKSSPTVAMTWAEITMPTLRTTLRSTSKLCRRTILRPSSGLRPIVFQA